MIEIIKTNKNKIFIGFGITVVLTGYCFLASLPLVIPLLLLFCGMYLILFEKTTSRRLLHFGLLLALIAACANAMISYSRFSPYFIPVVSVGMLTMLLFGDLELSFAMVFVSSAVVSLIAGVDLAFMLIVFMGGILAAYAVRDARTRGIVIWAGILAGFAQAFGYFLMHPEFTKDVFMDHMRPLFISGLVSSAVVLATLKIFEMLFGEMTNFTLMELSDSINQPLLKRLAFEAPGTYHHSLVLSNLAGAGADAINAKVLLVRVGAYYHDIGKLNKPEYFTENQIHVDNKHEDLEPSISRLVILNHVKEGIDLAEEEKLNPKIIDFIAQHHGTSLIHFFYQKALEDAGDDEISSEQYRYPGPKPQTKETAIVMLADAVEGATRAMDDRTPVKIEETVRKVVNNKFIDGQLDECTLTLCEINKICETFARTLSAMYHTRVKYPEARKNGR